MLYGSHGPWKYIYIHKASTQLFNPEQDPDEWINLSGHPDVREIEKELSNVLTGGAFDLELIERNVWERLSQKPIVNQAMAKNGTQREYPVEIDPATQYDRV